MSIFVYLEDGPTTYDLGDGFSIKPNELNYLMQVALEKVNKQKVFPLEKKSKILANRSAIRVLLD